MRILLLTAMMILASTASAGLYKWVDSEGSVHYSQKPPKNTSYKTIKAPPPAPTISSSQKSLEEGGEESNVEKTIQAETEKNRKLREQNCEIGKNNLKSYQTYRRMRDKDGNITVPSRKERAKQIESAKQLIREFCN